jgi:hypothetical protein
MPEVSRDECERTKTELHEKLDRVAEDVAYIKGKIDQNERTNGDWWARVGIILAALFAWWKGGA